MYFSGPRISICSNTLSECWPFLISFQRERTITLLRNVFYNVLENPWCMQTVTPGAWKLTLRTYFELYHNRTWYTLRSIFTNFGFLRARIRNVFCFKFKCFNMFTSKLRTREMMLITGIGSEGVGSRTSMHDRAQSGCLNPSTEL